MAEIISVDTDKVALAAKNISRINNEIRDDFVNVESTMKSLDRDWDSNVSLNAMESFNSIKNAFCDTHYNIMDSYVTFLLQQVDAGYTQTETANTSLSDAFK